MGMGHKKSSGLEGRMVCMDVAFYQYMGVKGSETTRREVTSPT